MTHPKKEHYQFAARQMDPAVVGRLGGGYPVPGLSWMQYLYGVGYYGGYNTGSTSNQGTDNDDKDSGSGSTGGDATGDSGDGSGSM